MTYQTFFPLVTIVALLVGCGGEAPPFRKATSPAKGKLTVDGTAPGSGIQIQCHPTAGPDATHPTVSAIESDADGNFSISTYQAGDGLPAGDYTLTFTWQEFNVMSRSYSGKDKLNGRYADPKTSPIKLSVKDGEENDMGTVALTTK